MLLGAAFSAAVLAGSMLVGDSAKHTLAQSALTRLGGIEYAIDARSRFFSDDLAERLNREAGVPTAAILKLTGIGLGSAGRQVNRVEVLGVDSRFWQFGAGTAPNLTESGVAVSRKLAAELDLAIGDELPIRVGKPGIVPADAPLSSRKDAVSRRVALVVEYVVPDSQLGRFSLSASQVAPYNAFVRLSRLQQSAELDGRANILLAGRPEGQDVSADGLARVLREAWSPTDAGLNLRKSKDGRILQLESDRIFLDPVIGDVALGRTGTVGTLSYLVNSISRGAGENAKATPYSFMVACSPGKGSEQGLSVIPAEMKDDEIIVNRWLADQLAAEPGDIVTVAYYEFSSANEFVERSRQFTVHSIIQMDLLATERELMPEFPGLSDVESCKDWDIGMPMDEDKLADKPNEEYWNRYRQTPKAFVTLNAGREMWANRFGELTGVRFEAGTYSRDDVNRALSCEIDPAALGLVFGAVREDATRAVAESLDLGELFLGMSFFLIISALLLTGMLFVFGVQQRAEQIGLLLAVGYRRAHTCFLLLVEGGLVVSAGVLVGAPLGVLYGRGMIWMLGRYWQGAIAGSAVQYYAGPRTVAVGAGVAFVCALAAMGFALLGHVRDNIRDLLASNFGGPVAKVLKRRHRVGVWLGVLSLASVLGILAGTIASGKEHPVMPFFAAGSFLLIAGICFVQWLISRLGCMEPEPAHLAAAGLGIRNIARRPWRSLTVVGSLACGCFLVFGVSSMKEDMTLNAGERWSGTGGFELYAEASLPLMYESAEKDRFGRFGLSDDARLAGVEFVACRIHDGDDASCLNLNRARTPRLVAVNPAEFSARRAFMEERGPDIWALLEQNTADGSVPALVGDANTAMWGLEAKTGPMSGDTLVYRDERGAEFKVRLVGKLPMRLSVFQGALLVSEEAFTGLYPSESGYRLFLVDVPEGGQEQVKEALTSGQDTFGLVVSDTSERLQEFYSVESAYLAMFLALGGLGLIVGSLGVGIAVLRNVLERRSEFALLRALGFSRSALETMVLREHGTLLVAGVLTGTIAAGVAMLPAFMSPAVNVPVGLLAAILAGILLIGLLLTRIAVRFALRGDLLSALRKE